jgi:hypothetical protein
MGGEIVNIGSKLVPVIEFGEFATVEVIST